MRRLFSLTWYDDALYDAWDTVLLDILLKMICGMFCTSTGYYYVSFHADTIQESFTCTTTT